MANLKCQHCAMRNESCDTVILCRSCLDKLSENEWISVEDRLPEDGDYDKAFLVTRQPKDSDAFTDKLKWFGYYKDWEVASVTAWMPLPAPLKESE